MRIIISILLLMTICFGYDEQILDAQAQVLPRIALLDKDLPNKLVNGKVLLVIAHDADDIDLARDMVSTINSKTGGKIGGYALKVVSVDFSSLSKQDMSLMYILDSSDANIKKAVNVAKNKNIISFAYSRESLELGAVVSLQIERTSVIMLNRTAMKNSGISFIDSFYRIVKMVN